MTKEVNDRRFEKGEQTREKILHAALSIISESGMQGVTAGKLALETGISKSNIFHHFKSINDIPLAVMEMIFKNIIRPVDSHEAKNLREYLTFLGQSVLDLPAEYKRFYKAFFSFYYEGMFNEAYSSFLNSYADQYKVLIGEEIQKLSGSKLSQIEYESMAALVLACLDGIGLHNLVSNDSKVYLQAWDMQVQLICNFADK